MKYYDNYKITSLDTKIKDQKDGYYSFEDTIFYPNKGGMLQDIGTINNLEVLDLKIIDNTLYHKVDGKLENPIHMEVDFNNRLINTSIQTAFHLLDGYYGRMGLYIIAIGVNHQNEWYEINSKDVDEKHLADVEKYINQAIKDEIKLDIKYINGKDYENEKYHDYDELRIVSYGDLDSQPCATLHLNHTGEIGNFIILDSEKTSRGTKIYCSIAKDIDSYFKHDHRMLKEISKKLSVKADEIDMRITKLLDDNNKLKKTNKLLEEKLLSYELNELVNTNKYINECQSNIKTLANNFLKLKLDKILYQINNPIDITIVSSSNKAKEIYELISKDLNVKGGGSNQIFSLKTSEDITKIIDVLGKIEKNCN